VAAADRTMFQIYRDTSYDGSFRVVYFTELDEHNKELEINRALNGEPFYDGFLADSAKDDAKQEITALLARLNAGEPLSADDVERTLDPYLVK